MKAKRLAAALMAFVMLFTLGACGGKGEEKETTTTVANASADVNAVKNYVGIESHNKEGEIIAAADRTVFGSSGLSVEVVENNESIFDGSVSFGDSLTESDACFDFTDMGMLGTLNNGEFKCSDGEKYALFDVIGLLASSKVEFDAVKQIISKLVGVEMDVDFEKVKGWADTIIKNGLNEDVIAEIFDTVATPLLVSYANKNGYSVKVEDVPGFKDLKNIVYDFFLKDYAAPALEINEINGMYDVKVDLMRLAQCAINYVRGHEDLMALSTNADVAKLLDTLYANTADLDGETFSFKVSVDGGYIKTVEVFEYKITFSDINTVDIDTEKAEVEAQINDDELETEVKSLGDIMKM